MNEVRFIFSDGGLGLLPESTDSVSAIVYYKSSGASLPEEWGDYPYNVIFGLKDAEALGIVKTDEEFGILHYQIMEFYRIQPAAKLYLYVVSAPGGSWTFEELLFLQQIANGEVKQALVYAPRKSYSAGDVTLLQTQLNELQGKGSNPGLLRPLSVLYAPNLRDWDLEDLDDLRSGDYAAEGVSVVIGQDAGGIGRSYFVADSSISIPAGGALLGAVSRSKVSYSIGWVEQNNLASGTELEVLGFSNGVLYTSKTYTLLTQLQNYGYLFLRKYEDYAGSYPNDSLTATDSTSDYGTIEHVRTANKVARAIRKALLPNISRPITLAAGGKVDVKAAAYLDGIMAIPLNAMVANEELSAFSARIDTTTNVVQTGKINSVIKLRPIGVAREYEVNLGFTVQ